MIASFQKLVLDTSGNLRCIEAYQSIINIELDRLSNESKSSSSSSEQSKDCILAPNSDKPEDLVVEFPNFVDKLFINTSGLQNDLSECFNGLHWKSKYVWLSDIPTVYKFGKGKYKSSEIRTFNGIDTLREKVNKEFNLDFDSCLITRYREKSQKLSLHQDNEKLFDSTYPICTVSVGDTRSLEFWDNSSEESGILVKTVELVEGMLVAMLPGCQKRLWHKVPRTNSPNKQGDHLRFAISFRKLLSVGSDSASLSVPSTPVKSGVVGGLLDGEIVTSTPIVNKTNSSHEPSSEPLQLKVLDNGFPVHPDRVHRGVAADSTVIETTAVNSPEPHQEDIQEPVAVTSDNVQHPEVTQPIHLVIGDSMVKGLEFPDNQTVSICKGGIQPHEVLQLLPSHQDILHHEQYDSIRTVTLIVGTNALNVPPGRKKGRPVLDVVYDYEKLIHELMDLFPNARIGLYNVIPRSYNSIETRRRIALFNDIFSDHVVTIYHNLFWIRQYWEFVDDFGFLRQDLYGKDGVHLKRKGKLLMSKAIVNFQRSYH